MSPIQALLNHTEGVLTMARVGIQHPDLAPGVQDLSQPEVDGRASEVTLAYCWVAEKEFIFKLPYYGYIHTWTRIYSR